MIIYFDECFFGNECDDCAGAFEKTLVDAVNIGG